MEYRISYNFHEVDNEEVSAEKVRATIDIMGFCLDSKLMPKGQLIYSKHPSKLRPPRQKKSGLNKRMNKKIYFDNDGNPYPAPDSEDEMEIRTDYDYNEVVAIENAKFQHSNVNPTKDSLRSEARKPDVALTKSRNSNIKAHREFKPLDVEKTDIKNRMFSDVIGPKNIAIDKWDKDIVRKQVTLPDSTYVDTKESDETKKYLSRPARPRTNDLRMKTVQQIKNEIVLANLMPKFKKAAVEVAEVPRPELTGKKSRTKLEEDVLPLKSKVTVASLENPEYVKGDFVTNSGEALEIDDRGFQEKLEIEQEINDSPVEENMYQACGWKPKVYNRWGDVIGEKDMPPELLNDRRMIKYWKKRHSLFHRFDEGIQLDRESWFSVTPESVAWHIANKFPYDVVLDAFCGAGGNTIQFARTCGKVIAVDIDPVKIEMARHNARVYGVEDRIEFVVGDFFKLAPKLQADMVFLSPPWGGPNYSEVTEYDLETMLEPRPASELMAVARQITPYIALYVPRNTKIDQLINLGKRKGGSVEVEQSYLGKRFVAITAYYF